MLILSNDEVAQVLSMELCLRSLEQAFLEYTKGEAVAIPRIDTSISTSFARIAARMGVPEQDLYRRMPPGEAPPEAMDGDPIYRFKVQVGAVPAQGAMALRLNSDIISFPHIGGGARQYKLPLVGGYHYCGLVFLFSAVNGEPIALFPDGELGRMRVGGTTGLGIKYLARKNASVVALLGAGWQAGAQLMAAVCARQVGEVRVYSPTVLRRENFARQMAEKLRVSIKPVASAREAVEGSDIVLSATNSLTPVLNGAWLAPGAHMSVIATPEPDPATYQRAGLIVLTTRSHLEIGDRVDYVPPSLEGKIALKKDHGQVKERLPRLEEIPELPEIISGLRPGRKSDQEITLHINNTFALQFPAVGMSVVEEARRLGLGREIPTDWFLQDVHT